MTFQLSIYKAVAKATPKNSKREIGVKFLEKTEYSVVTQTRHENVTYIARRTMLSHLCIVGLYLKVVIRALSIILNVVACDTSHLESSSHIYIRSPIHIQSMCGGIAKRGGRERSRTGAEYITCNIQRKTHSQQQHDDEPKK